DSGMGIDSKSVEVTNAAPSAIIIGAPASSLEGTAIHLTSDLADPGSADTFTYAWVVTKNSQPYGTGDQSAFAFTPEDDGEYAVTRRASDLDSGMGIDSKSVEVTNAAPSATITGLPASSLEGTAIHLTSDVADPGSADTFTYA